MRGTTHLAAGLAAAALTGNLETATLVGMALGSVLPDIDSPKSLVGKYVPVIPQILPHRTITHSGMVCALLWMLCPAVGFGAAIHLFLDMFNPEGVPIFWPISKKFRVPIVSYIIPSGGLIDTAIGVALVFFNVYLYWPIVLGHAFPYPFGG